MHIVPVLDLAAGRAVHARRGDRAHYAPVESVLVPGGPAGVLALARAFREQLSARSCYVADLDAIQGGAIQSGLLRRLASPAGFDGPLYVDAGVQTPARARGVLAAGAARVIVGLETLPSFASFSAIVADVGAERVIFSLDLRLGHPIVHPALFDYGGGEPDVLELAERAADAGAGTVLLLDLGRVGTGVGIDLGLFTALRRRLPRVELLAGGGVLTVRDLEQLAATGCDGALVASAIHAGRLTARDIAVLRQAGPSDQSGEREVR